MKKKLLCAALILVLTTLFYVDGKGQTISAKKGIGLQLYSVRDMLGSNVTPDIDYASNMDPVLQKIASMGYMVLEAAGYKEGKFYNLSPQEFKNTIERSGMKVISSHTGRSLSKKEIESGDLSESLAWWDSCIKAHKDAGISYIVTPWIDFPKSLAELKVQCDYMNAIGKKCLEYGIRYGYHNHSHEFRKVENKEIMLDYMLANTDPDHVFFEMDVYWTVIGRSSPVDYFNKYPGRFKLLHIKDHREIGQSGMVGFDAIFKQAKVAGVEHFFVEIEGTTHSLEDGLKESIDYLLKADFVPYK